MNGRIRELATSHIVISSSRLLSDLRRLGQTTQVSRSTLSQVREKIRQLREATANKVTAKNYDFASRLAEVRKDEADQKQRRKDEKKRKREEKREEEELARMGIVKRNKVDDDEVEIPVADPNSQVNGKSRRERKREAKGIAKADEGPDKEVEAAQKDHADLSAMMGFGGFGGERKR